VDIMIVKYYKYYEILRNVCATRLFKKL